MQKNALSVMVKDKLKQAILQAGSSVTVVMG